MKARKKPRNRKKFKSFSYSAFLGIILLLGVLGHTIFFLGRGAVQQRQLEIDSVVTQAVVIDEKNYFGNSPVSHQFSYSYRFVVNGKTYTGNTRDSKCRVGDVIRVKYVLANPDVNRKLDEE